MSNRVFDFDNVLVDGKLYPPPNSLVVVSSDSKAGTLVKETAVLSSGAPQQIVLAGSDFLFRKVRRTGIRIGYSAGNSMPGIMHRHLSMLHDTQKPFWMEFDAAMSRDYAVCQPADQSGLNWITPTHPITPRACDPGDAVVWTGALRVNGVVRASGWTIDAEEGLVVFDAEEDVTLHSRVQLLYRWRMPAVITNYAVTESKPGDRVAVARSYADGTMLIEQWLGTLPAWTTPVMGEDFDPEDYDG